MKSIQTVVGASSHENDFIRQAIGQGIRLDGRRTNDFREVEINLSRAEMSAVATVSVGSSRVTTVVSADIVPPYPDRPTEGLLQFNAVVSPLSEAFGVSQAELTRLLDRSIRESEAIDTESLCIVSGEKVWLISCDVRVLDCSSGNIIDIALLSVMGALRAFRKPEISVTSSSDALDSRTITMHKSDDREPLPLALHHTPLSVSLGIFRSIKMLDQSNQDHDNLSQVVLVTDPSLEEEACMDGMITFSINGHRELCSINKPGKAAISSSIVLHATKIATERASVLHGILNTALQQLETDVILERSVRLDKLRIFSNTINNDPSKNNFVNGNVVDGTVICVGDSVGVVAVGGGGIDRDDPMLAWTSLHQAAGLRETE